MEPIQAAKDKKQ